MQWNRANAAWTEHECREARALIIHCTIKAGLNVEENDEQTYAKHDIDPWRAVIAAAPLVAIAALAVGLNGEARAEHESAIEVLRGAGWVATVVALAWFCIVASLAVAGLVTVVTAMGMAAQEAAEGGSTDARVINAEVAHGTTTRIKIDGDWLTSLRSFDAQVEIGRRDGTELDNTVHVFADRGGTIRAQAGDNAEQRTYEVEARTTSGHAYQVILNVVTGPVPTMIVVSAAERGSGTGRMRRRLNTSVERPGPNVVATPLVAAAALVGGVSINAGATLQSEIELLRSASLVIGASAFAWVGIVTMIFGVRRNSTPFEIRMVFEQKSRKAFVADAVSILCAAVTFAVLVAMVV